MHIEINQQKCQFLCHIHVNLYMYLQARTTAIHRISKQILNTFSIGEYTKTMYSWLSYAPVDDCLERMTPC